jgi:sec-independent protein translocase protein TatA
MPELLMVLAIVVLLFGGKKIPELAKGLGKGIKDFKKAVNEDDDTEEKKSVAKTAGELENGGSESTSEQSETKQTEKA